MKKFIIAFFLISICFSLHSAAQQIQTNVLVQIVKAEDERRFDAVLENLLKNPNAKIRARAALAAGRIGADAAIPSLTPLLKEDTSPEVRMMAAFALGEIESIKAADTILNILKDSKTPDAVRARAVEAAGKIAAANAQNDKSKDLGKAIVKTLESEEERGAQQSGDVVLHGLTAVLRARPEDGASQTAKFLTSPDERIRIDAGNTLTRLRAKNANEALRKMLTSDPNAVARANAARALGAAEDKDSLEPLLNAALTDADARVRVSAIRAVAGLKEPKVAAQLIKRGGNLLAVYKKNRLASANPLEKSELLEIATALGRLLPNSDEKAAVDFLDGFRQEDKYSSPETEIALARIAPRIYVESVIADSESLFRGNWRISSAVFQGLGEIAGAPSNKETDAVKSSTRILLVRLISGWLTANPKDNARRQTEMAVPDLIRAFAAFKSENTSGLMRSLLEIEPDPFIRAAIAEVLAEQPASPENIEALKKALDYSLLNDKTYNDATLAIMDALAKAGKKSSSGALSQAAKSTNFLVRRKAVELIKQIPPDVIYSEKDFANMIGTVRPYDPRNGSKLGVLLNTNVDYTRAVARKNGSVKAVLTTEKGAFTIDFAPEDAPLTVDNFIRLARAGYFNGLAVHRVVPNFVMQDGDPRGDGNGGPGWEIRCEINLLSYERGAVGMALSGKDTGGSQWFVTHSPQPHLDGGYTVFGRVSEADMKTVDKIVRGDRILSVKIVEAASRQGAKTQRKK